LPPRDREEAHRSSTSLELMFDLATATAVAVCSLVLVQDIKANHVDQGIARFACNFFMTWLAWANYTWFASGYDNKSTAFRAVSMFIMFGSLTLAGGIQSSMADRHQWLVMIGFSIMRLGMIVLWIGAAIGDRRVRPTAVRYIVGIAAMQIYWNTLIILLPQQAPFYFVLFALGAVGELMVPLVAERRGASNWHHDHIIDRYNSFNIIVLNECFASVALIIAISPVPDFKHFWLAGLCSIIAFSMWGLYFDRHKQLQNRRLKTVFSWAYGHYFLFAGGAAMSAGFSIYLGSTVSGTGIGKSAGLAIGVPVSMYVSALWLVRDRQSRLTSLRWFLLAVAGLVLLSSMFFAYAPEWIAALLASCVFVRNRLYFASPES
jgi:low temperature requirement protein LtrA